MNEIAITPEFAPYLNHDYWDGHFFNDEDIAPDPETVLSHQPELARSAYKLLAEIAQTRSSKFALETFRGGDTFDPQDHRPGTITVLRQELLWLHPDLKTFDQSPFSDLKRPNRPLSLPSSFINTVPFSMWTPVEPMPHLNKQPAWKGFVYQTAAYWRVVQTRGKNQNVLSNADIVSTLPPRSVLNAEFHYPSKMQIGQVIHTLPVENTPGQLLKRTTILEIVSYGSVQKNKKQVHLFLGKLAGNHI